MFSDYILGLNYVLRLNHQLSGLFDVNSLASTGHLVHVDFYYTFYFFFTFLGPSFTFPSLFVSLIIWYFLLNLFVFLVYLIFYLLVKHVKIEKILKIFQNPTQARKTHNPAFSYSSHHGLCPGPQSSFIRTIHSQFLGLNKTFNSCRFLLHFFSLFLHS